MLQISPIHKFTTSMHRLKRFSINASEGPKPTNFRIIPKILINIRLNRSGAAGFVIERATGRTRY